jgi:hypothetical protein
LEDFIAGLVTGAIGAFLIYEAWGYGLGTLRQMGPGYFPMMIGAFMVVLAVITIVAARPTNAPGSIGLDQLRGILFLTAAFLAFVYTVEAFGMLLSVFLAVFLSALGNSNTPIKLAAFLAIVTAIAATLIFRVGLGLQIEAY